MILDYTTSVIHNSRYSHSYESFLEQQKSYSWWLVSLNRMLAD